jgi:outer membrane protein assembly factor BamB
VLWQHSYPAELGDKFFEGGTTGTPTLDGDGLFTLSRWGDLFCFEAASGKIIWSKNVQKETGARIPDWGFTGAPLAHENLLVLNVGRGLALDRTGNIIWQSANKAPSTRCPSARRAMAAWLGNATGYVAVHTACGKPGAFAGLRVRRQRQ